MRHRPHAKNLTFARLQDSGCAWNSLFRNGFTNEFANGLTSGCLSTRRSTIPGEIRNKKDGIRNTKEGIRKKEYEIRNQKSEIRHQPFQPCRSCRFAHLPGIGSSRFSVLGSFSVLLFSDGRRAISPAGTKSKENHFRLVQRGPKEGVQLLRTHDARRTTHGHG